MAQMNRMDEQIWRRRLDREIKARKQAESILEKKSLELYHANQDLKRLNAQLKDSLFDNINALQESESEKFALFENAAVGMVVCVEDKMFKVNQCLIEMLGGSERELTGRSIYELIYLDDRSEFCEKVDHLFDKRIEHFSHEARLKKKNGTIFWGHFNVAPIKHIVEGIKYHLFIIENIQETKNYETNQEALIGQLKEINGQLENFAHVVSHDLKAPLNGMNTVMEWIRKYMEKKGVDEEMKEYLLLVDDRVSKMYRLIEGVMEYSKVSSLDERREEVDVKEALDESIHVLNIPEHIQFKFSGVFPRIRANRLKLKQVFMNLIDNAIRHNDKKRGLIEIKAKQNDRFWIFVVEDNGKGIPQRYLNKIFKIFNTLDTTGKHTGIGLALVKRVVEHYKGSITVDSVEGERTSFTFTLEKATVNIP